MVRLTKTSLAWTACFSLLIAALICAGFYLFWYSDALELENAKRALLEQEEKEIRALETTSRYLPEFQREVCLLEARLMTLRAHLPLERQKGNIHEGRAQSGN